MGSKVAFPPDLVCILNGDIYRMDPRTLRHVLKRPVEKQTPYGSDPIDPFISESRKRERNLRLGTASAINRSEILAK